MPVSPHGNIHEFSVTELSTAIKRTIEEGFSFVRVRGELGRVTRAASGHMYLDLKDEKAAISGVIWKGNAARLKIVPEQGMEVVATGKLTTFPGQSRYQIVIDSLEPAGVGALMALFEERKKKLASEGLFDASRKATLPFMPEVIGVVTSPSGAVIRDILHRLRDRFPVHVLVWPTLVQGRDAAPQIVSAIKGFNALKENGLVPRPDVLIVARGGGSLEDLWCFNEEAVARAAAESEIPLVSAVGHETDTTLIDFVSDQRAPTPTAAAEMAVPVRSELLGEILNKERRLISGSARKVDDAKNSLRASVRVLGRPEDLLSSAMQKLDRATGLLSAGLRARASDARLRMARGGANLNQKSLAIMIERMSGRMAEQRYRLHQSISLSLLGEKEQLEKMTAFMSTMSVQGLRVRFVELASNLSPQSFVGALDRMGERVESLRLGLERSPEYFLRRRHDMVSTSGRLLETLSFQGVLQRGFAIVKNDQGGVVRRAGEMDEAASVQLIFADGERKAFLDDEQAKTKQKSSEPKSRDGKASKAASKASVKKADVQKSLFD